MGKRIGPGNQGRQESEAKIQEENRGCQHVKKELTKCRSKKGPERKTRAYDKGREIGGIHAGPRTKGGEAHNGGAKTAHTGGWRGEGPKKKERYKRIGRGLGRTLRQGSTNVCLQQGGTSKGASMGGRCE